MVMYKIRVVVFVVYLQSLYVLIVLDKKLIAIFLGFNEFWSLSSFPGPLKWL
jgi:hypothetical protein